jgi:hypothetical protein
MGQGEPGIVGAAGGEDDLIGLGGLGLSEGTAAQNGQGGEQEKGKLEFFHGALLWDCRSNTTGPYFANTIGQDFSAGKYNHAQHVKIQTVFQVDGAALSAASFSGEKNEQFCKSVLSQYFPQVSGAKSSGNADKDCGKRVTQLVSEEKSPYSFLIRSGDSFPDWMKPHLRP